MSQHVFLSGTAHYLSDRGYRAGNIYKKLSKEVLVPSEKHDKRIFAPYLCKKKVCVPSDNKEIFSFISMVKYYYLKH